MNTFLRRARLQVKLTQEELASVLGTTAVSIWRWEAGRTPSPFYRKAICAYFHRSPAEFGWSLPGRKGKSHGSPLFPLVDPSIPDLESQLLGQQRLLTQVCELLCGSLGPQRVGLTGLVGSGKTIIAQSLAALPQIHDTFAGVLWASLGPEAYPMRHLRRWANVLGLDSLPAEPRAAQDTLRVAIGRRRILVVLDDVWTQADVTPLRIGGQTCRYLVTTRQPGLAHQLCQQVLQVQDLTEEAAFALLVAGLPVTVVCEHKQILQKLIRSVGKLPLALVLMREHLQREAHVQPRRLREAILRLVQRLCYMGAPDLLQMEMPWQATTLFAAIQQSEARLSLTACAAFRILASRLQDAPFTESEAAALVLQKNLQQELDCLMDAGLLSWENDNYRFHPIIAEYARLTEPEQQGERELPETCHLSEIAYPGRSRPLMN